MPRGTCDTSSDPIGNCPVCFDDFQRKQPNQKHCSPQCSASARMKRYLKKKLAEQTVPEGYRLVKDEGGSPKKTTP